MTEKHDANKPRWDLFPLSVAQGVVDVLTFGADKYTDDGWKHVPDGERRYFAALMRHLAAYQSGELVDEESGLSHLDHAGCCLMFLRYFQMEFDNPESTG